MPSESEHKNTYFVLRHDESLAMKQGLVVSLAENGVGKFGITEEGRRHTRQTILQALDEETVPKGVVIVSTDFDRGLQTAQEAAQILQPKAFHVSPLLRERGFQAYELSSDANYQIVWENDENEKPTEGVESPESVAQRFSECIKFCEAEYTDEVIIFVSHGDTLQIGISSENGESPFHHRRISPLKAGELRRLFPQENT